MKSSLTNELSCSVFGHNFYRSKPLSQNKAELICSCCHTKVSTDSNGDFEELPSSNTEIHKALRQLFLLRKQVSNYKISA